MTTDQGQRFPALTSWLGLILLALIWGASFLSAKFALISFGPLSVAAARLGIGAALMIALAYALGRKLPAMRTRTDARIWLHCLGMALFSNAIPFTLLNWGQLHVTSGFAGITMAVVPLMVLPLAYLFVPGETLGWPKVTGFLIGFCGVAVLIGPAALGATGGTLEPIARMACVLASCCYATGGIITRLCPPVSVMGFSAAALSIASLIMIPLALRIEGAPTMSPDPTALTGLLFLGIFPTAIATVMLVYLINTEGPTFLSLVNYQVPIWAVILGVAIMAEPLPASFTAALALILTGLAISQGGTYLRQRS